MTEIDNAYCNKCMNNLKDKLESKIDNEVKSIYKALDSKVSWKHFTWIVSTILGLYIVISAAIWLDLREMKSNVQADLNLAKVDLNIVSNDVTVIKTILQQAEIIK